MFGYIRTTVNHKIEPPHTTLNVRENYFNYIHLTRRAAVYFGRMIVFFFTPSPLVFVDGGDSLKRE